MIPDATPAHIEPDAFRSYLQRLGFDATADSQPDYEDDLRNRAVVVESGGELHATIYGVLAFGKDPQRHLETRNFRIECVVHGGDDRAANVLQVASAAGRIDEQVERATEWFLGLGRFESCRSLIREDRHLLPRAAIREALVNAAVHRDYAITGSRILFEVFDRRVEITSPGALPGRMTVDKVRAGANPRSRNKSLAYFMAAMGFMGHRGTGWLTMCREMRVFNGNGAGVDAGRARQLRSCDLSTGSPRKRGNDRVTMAGRVVHETPFAAAEPASAVRKGGRAYAGRMERAMRRRRPDGRAAAAALAAAMLAAGCVPAGEPAPGAPEGAGTGARPGQAALSARGVERWQCGDRYDGCVFRCPVTLTADRLLGVGTITIDGAIEQATAFHMDGLDRRWNWCLGGGWQLPLFRHDRSKRGWPVLQVHARRIDGEAVPVLRLPGGCGREQLPDVPRVWWFRPARNFRLWGLWRPREDHRSLEGACRGPGRSPPARAEPLA